jgi:hypothetical protein
VGERTAEAVELPDDQDIFFASDGRSLGELRAIGAGTAEAFSSKMRLQPARLSASICNLVFWSSVKTRA